MVTRTVYDLQKLYDPDAKYFAENLIEIEDRNRNRIRFILNPAQELLNGNITGRDIVIKAGQLGITTYFLARYFKEVITKIGTTAVVVAHQEHLTTRLLDRMRKMYNYMPDQYAVRYPDGHVEMMKKPPLKHDSAHEMSFPSINGVFYIGTARAYVFGRGEPIHRFLGSEVAFWPNADEILAPALQRVPLSGEAVLESTPNGEGGQFFERVQESMAGIGIWNLHLLHWWLEPEYRIPRNSSYSLPADYGEIKDYSEEEVTIIKVAKWDDIEAEERVRWRRRKISEINRKFWQEFMEDVVTCFLSAGRTFYKHEEVDRLRADVYPCTVKVPLQHSGGVMKIWETPDDEWDFPNYLISVDPGQGKTTQSVAAVWKMLGPHEIEEGGKSIIHVATLHGLYEPDVFAPMVIEMAEYYKRGKIAPERNGHGMAFTSRIRDYPNVYRQIDIISKVRKRVIGWKTTGQAKVDGTGTKIYAMDELNAVLPEVECHDENIVGQIGATRIGPDNVVIWVGKSNDFHDAAMIMAAVRPGARGGSQRGVSYKE